MAATGAEPISAENIKEALEALLASDALSDAIMGVVADYEASRTYWTGSVTIKNDYNGSYFWPSITASGVSAFGIEMDKVSVGYESRWGLACFELEVGKSYMVAFDVTQRDLGSSIECGFTSTDPTTSDFVPAVQVEVEDGANRVFEDTSSKWLDVYSEGNDPNRNTTSASVSIRKVD